MAAVVGVVEEALCVCGLGVHAAREPGHRHEGDDGQAACLAERAAEGDHPTQWESEQAQISRAGSKAQYGS